MLISDIVLNHQNRANAALFTAQMRFEICVINITTVILLRRGIHCASFLSFRSVGTPLVFDWLPEGIIILGVCSRGFPAEHGTSHHCCFLRFGHAIGSIQSSCTFFLGSVLREYIRGCVTFLTFGDDNQLPGGPQRTETAFRERLPQRNDAVTTLVLIRLVLDYVDDLDEAVEIAKAYDMHDSAGTSYYYMAADASGRSAIFEWANGTDDTDLDGSARQLVITYNDQDSYIGQAEGDSDFQWVTNFVIQPGYYDNEEDMKNLDRYQHIYERLAGIEGTVADEKGAMDILASVGRRSWNSNGEHLTVHSVIYNLSKKNSLLDAK